MKLEETNLVVKSNKLIEARYDLNLNEQKIILYAVSKLDRNKDKFNLLQLEVKEFTGLIDTSPKRYSEIREVIKSMLDRKLIINTEKSELMMHWLSSAEYLKDSGIIELEFSEKLIPYLLQLKQQYTQYELKNILYLKNKYAIRIYEVLKQYQKIGNREFDLEKLKEIIGCKNKYDDFRNFKKKVLDVSKKELCEHTDICFEYEKISKGRKIVGIKFQIESKVEEDEQKKLKKKAFELFGREEQVNDIKEKCGLKNETFTDMQIMDLYEVAINKTDPRGLSPYQYVQLNYSYIIDKNPTNKFKYLMESLEKDWAKAIRTLRYKSTD